MIYIAVMSHERHGVSNHRQFDSLFSRMFRLRRTEASMVRIIHHLWGESIEPIYRLIYFTPFQAPNELFAKSSTIFYIFDTSWIKYMYHFFLHLSQLLTIALKWCYQYERTKLSVTKISTMKTFFVLFIRWSQRGTHNLCVLVVTCHWCHVYIRY